MYLFVYIFDFLCHALFLWAPHISPITVFTFNFIPLVLFKAFPTLFLPLPSLMQRKPIFPLPWPLFYHNSSFTTRKTKTSFIQIPFLARRHWILEIPFSEYIFLSPDQNHTYFPSSLPKEVPPSNFYVAWRASVSSQQEWQRIIEKLCI